MAFFLLFCVWYKVYIIVGYKNKIPSHIRASLNRHCSSECFLYFFIFFPQIVADATRILKKKTPCVGYVNKISMAISSFYAFRRNVVLILLYYYLHIISRWSETATTTVEDACMYILCDILRFVTTFILNNIDNVANCCIYLWTRLNICLIEISKNCWAT